MAEDTEFPDAVNFLTARRGDAYFHTHLRKRMVDAERVNDWFKRCMAELSFMDKPFGDDTKVAHMKIWRKEWLGQFKEVQKTKKRLLNLLDPITGIDRQIVLEVPDELHGSKVMDYFVSLLEGKHTPPEYISVEEF